MSKIKKNEDTTLIAGTEMKSKDTAYIIPIFLTVIAIVFMLLNYLKTGFIILLISVLLMIMIAVRQRKR